MRPTPKPTKRERAQVVRERKSSLGDYRRIQAALAIERDNAQCVFCHFIYGKTTDSADVHHVWGRGKTAGDYREHYTSLLCTCREHHPQPILTGGDLHLDYVQQIRVLANDVPINPRFIKP